MLAEWWKAWLIGAIVFALSTYFLVLSKPNGSIAGNEGSNTLFWNSWSFDSERDQRNLGLTDAQCDVSATSAERAAFH